MAKKNEMTQSNDFSNSIVELSDEDLQQIVGGDGGDSTKVKVKVKIKVVVKK
jgi:bacteriocin-like protein